mmetsp:Transcript_17004/g.38269  ORF Transcript_17004/g.38269 Transcript_17004/m.38269 type:complete len:303 (-) Transcript_17004:283-1191(-)
MQKKLRKKLQKIVRRPPGRFVWLPSPRRGIELQKALLQMLVDLHDRRLVPAPVAVVGRAEYGDDVHLVYPVVPVHHQLMRPADQTQPVPMVVLLADVLSEGEPGPPGRDAPSDPVVRIAPEEVAHGSVVGHLLHAVERADLVQGIDGGGEAAVEAEDVVLDHRGEGEVVEEAHEEVPDVGGAVLADTLVVKAVAFGTRGRGGRFSAGAAGDEKKKQEDLHLRDLPRLVVSPQYVHPLRISDLERHEHAHGLDGIVSPVHVVPHEEVVGVRRRTADPEQLHEIVPLSVYVPAHGHGARDRLHV